jgi:hypothetical protein
MRPIRRQLLEVAELAAERNSPRTGRAHASFNQLFDGFGEAEQ